MRVRDPTVWCLTDFGRGNLCVVSVEQRRRAAYTEVNVRRVNEAIERGHRRDERLVVLCECGRIGCNTTLDISLAEYERVRSAFDRFLLAPGHEIDAIERVAERYPDHIVVVKTGAAAVVAREGEGP
jgi:hypothetical protein